MCWQINNNIFNWVSELLLIYCFIAITCSAPLPGENTVDLPNDVTDGLSYLESYTYSCREGYTTTDELCTVCQPDGSLSLATPPRCAGESSQIYNVCSL